MRVTYALRVRDDATGPHAGQVTGRCATRQEAEAIRQTTPGGEHMEVVEVSEA